MIKQLFIITLISVFSLFAQDSKKEIEEAEGQLNQLKREISNLQRKLQKSERNLQTYLTDLKNLDNQTTKQHKVLRILQDEIQRNRSTISRLNSQIGDLDSQIANLQDIFRKQIVFTYRYLNGRELEWLLGSDNFNQALIRLRYFQTISQSAKRVYQRLQEKQIELQTLHDNRKLELGQKLSLIHI